MPTTNTLSSTTTTTTPTPPVDLLAASRARKRAQREEQIWADLEGRILNQRWPISRQVRGEVVDVALRLCGLEVDDDGKFKLTGARPQPPRVRLAALRVLASFDKLSIDQRKVDLKQYPPAGIKPIPEPEEPRRKISEEVGTECLMLMANAPPPPPEAIPKPEPPPERDLTAELIDTRWPILGDVRVALIGIAAGLCGVSASGAAKPIEQSPEPDDSPQTTRIVLGALRIFARFDRLSLEHRRVELKYRPPEENRPRYPLDPALAAQIAELCDADERRQLEREYAAEQAARAAAADDGT